MADTCECLAAVGGGGHVCARCRKVHEMMVERRARLDRINRARLLRRKKRLAAAAAEIRFAAYAAGRTRSLRRRRGDLDR